MKNVYIFGHKALGRYAYARWKMYPTPGYQVVGFASTRRNGTCEGLPIVNVREIEPDATVIIALTAKYVVEVYRVLEQQGIKSIYKFLNWRNDVEGDNFFARECVAVEGYPDNTLPYAEVHAADHCNLNCRGCTHYSPIFARELPDLKKRLEDVRALRAKFSAIACLHVLGGEPLLHPELDGFLRDLRELLPETDIYLVTNGLLVPQMPERLVRAIVDGQITVLISEYAPTHRMMGQIAEKLKQWGIRYALREYDEKQIFNKPLSLRVPSKYKQKCISDGCISVWNGKIARCPSLMYIDRFNEVFGTSLPNQGIYDLKDCPDGKELLRLMQEEVPLCKHCVENEIPWSACGTHCTVSDFAEDE